MRTMEEYSVSEFAEGGKLVIYIAYAMIGLAVYIIAHMLLREQESRQAEEQLEETGDRTASDPFLKFTRPFFTQYIVPMVRGKPFWDKARTKYRRQLISSGLKSELTPDEMISFKAFLVIFFPIVAGLLKALDVFDLEIYWILGSGILGWFYPDWWVKGRIQQRQKEILNAMPFIVDLLALSTEAGLDFVGAIGKVVEKAAKSPLVDEFEQLLKEIKVGSSRGEAMREMAARINMTEVNSFIAILISAEQMGASIGNILRQQSDQIRGARMLRAEKAGAAVAPKLIGITIFFILPAVMLMIGAPFALSAFSGGGF